MTSGHITVGQPPHLVILGLDSRIYVLWKHRRYQLRVALAVRPISWSHRLLFDWHTRGCVRSITSTRHLTVREVIDSNAVTRTFVPAVLVHYIVKGLVVRFFKWRRVAGRRRWVPRFVLVSSRKALCWGRIHIWRRHIWRRHNSCFAVSTTSDCSGGVTGYKNFTFSHRGQSRITKAPPGIILGCPQWLTSCGGFTGGYQVRLAFALSLTDGRHPGFFSLFINCLGSGAEVKLHVEALFWQWISFGVFVQHQDNLSHVIQFRDLGKIVQRFVPLLIFDALKKEKKKKKVSSVKPEAMYSSRSFIWVVTICGSSDSSTSTHLKQFSISESIDDGVHVTLTSKVKSRANMTIGRHHTLRISTGKEKKDYGSTLFVQFRLLHNPVCPVLTTKQPCLSSFDYETTLFIQFWLWNSPDYPVWTTAEPFFVQFWLRKPHSQIHQHFVCMH